MIIETFFKRTFFDSPMGMIIPIIIINIVNFKRYDKIITFEMLEEKWNQESSKSRIKNGVLVILYMFFSTAFLIISGYILYNQPWRMIELLHK
jgi:hypothetical protein